MRWEPKSLPSTVPKFWERADLEDSRADERELLTKSWVRLLEFRRLRLAS